MSESASQPPGQFLHKFSGTTFRIEPSSAGKMIQRMTRAGLTAYNPIAYVVGSGDHAFGYLVETSHRLFQSPIAYYTWRQIWDMAPGFETDAEPEFDRPAVPECLECHAGRPRPLRNTLNQYEAPPFAQLSISCDRCHGDATAHVLRPNRKNIINPAELAPRARDSVCEQCHLSGEVRILNPGREFSDFHPGQDLENAFSVYVRSGNAQAPAANSIKVVSHVEQLALSACARASGVRMWCGSCHDPHLKPVNPTAYFRDRCLTCHGQALLQKHPRMSSINKSRKPKTAELGAELVDCIGCHMPKRLAKDGGHTAFTDHRITRIPAKATAIDDQDTTPGDLIAWHDPSGHLTTRNLGLANVHVGERYHSASHLEKGAAQLALAMKTLPEDAAILTSLGFVLLRQGMPADAVEFFQYASRMDPANAGYHVNLAAAYREIGSLDQAIAQLEESLTRDPSLAVAYNRLTDIFRERKDVVALRRTLERYLAVAPGNMRARAALRKLDLK